MKFCLISHHVPTGKWIHQLNDISVWAYAMDGDVHNGLGIDDYSQFDKYDVVMVNMSFNMLDICCNLKSKSKAFVIGLVEGSLIPHWPFEALSRYKDVLNTIDMVGVINSKGLEAIRALTSKPACFIGVPYPLAWAKGHISSAKNPIIELSTQVIGRGGIWNTITINKLNHHVVCYPTGLTSDDIRSILEMAGPSLQFLPVKGWHEYFIEHSQYYLGLHLDQGYTWGRFPLDCAAANIPCVSTPYSHTQSILFPELVVEYYEVDKAAKLCNRLFQDKEFYNRVVDYANEHIKQFDLENSRQRLLCCLRDQGTVAEPFPSCPVPAPPLRHNGPSHLPYEWRSAIRIHSRYSRVSRNK